MNYRQKRRISHGNQRMTALDRKKALAEPTIYELFDRASANHQTKIVFERITEIGQSRHKDKMKARELGAKTPDEIAKLTAIHSISTRRTYGKWCSAFLEFCRNEANYDISETLPPEKNSFRLNEWHVQKFLESKKHVKISSMSTITASLKKFATALNSIDGRQRNWDKICDEIKPACQPVEKTTRAFERPLDLFEYLNDTHRILAELQLFAGLRIDEGARLTSSNLSNGALHLFNTKGGRYRTTIPLPDQTYKALKNFIQEYGFFEVEKPAYQKALYEATLRSNQKVSGSHGLRHNYAQHRMMTLRDKGFSELEAMKRVSAELGHNRPGVVRIYLR